jgi:peptidoglycan LD-endopeptidase CwlK
MNKLASSNPQLRPYFTALFQIATKMNPNAYVSSVKRGSAKQRELYRNYVAGRSRYPAAPPGTSKHELGRALDIGGMTPAQLSYLGAVWRSWGGTWGGDFRDPIHFQV